MNTRLIGKIFIGFGVLMMLVYIGWIVFRVVRQPGEVEKNGLLPNPFDLVVPSARPSVDTTVTPAGGTTSTGVTVTEIPNAPDKKLFRISQSPALSFTVIPGTVEQESVNVLTGASEKKTVPTETVRYVTRDEGFVVDAVVSNTDIKEKRVSNAFISGLYSVDVGRYSVVGQYRTPGASTSTSYTLPIEKLPTVTQQKVAPIIPACKYVLTKVVLSDIGSSVESIQQVLISSGVVAPFSVGVFDDAMKSAVIDYQTKSNIVPASGLVGAKTLSRMNADCIRLLPKIARVETPQELTARDQLSVVALPKGVYRVSLLDDIHMFMLVNSGGKNRGVIRDIATGNDTEIYSLGFVDWYSALLDTDTVLMTTVPSGAVGGYAFAVSINNKTMRPLLSSITGLATLPSPDGKHILYSSTEGGLPTLSLYAVATRDVTLINMQTFAEKCVWTSDSASIYCLVPTLLPGSLQYPDEWYKRGIDISDELRRYQVTNKAVEVLDSNREIPEIQVDGIESSVTVDQSLYIFRDWKTGYIWGYRLK